MKVKNLKDYFLDKIRINRFKRFNKKIFLQKKNENKRSRKNYTHFK